MVTEKFSRMDRGDKTFVIVNYAIALLLSAIALYPLIFVLSASFSDPDMVLKGKVILLPKGFTLKPYSMVFQNEDIWRGYLNTIIYTGVGTLVNVVMTVMLAYPLSRPDLPLRRPITLLIVFTMYFDGGMIPNYLLVRSLGMYNTMWALIIPVAISTYNLIVAKSFFENSIPREMYESASIDGASDLRTMVQIVLPLSQAIIAVLTLFYAVTHWNSYFSALIYLKDESKNPLQIILRDILLLGQTEQMGSNDVGMGEKIKMSEAIKYSSIVISSVPILCAYPFVQKYFVKGVMIGAVKG